MTVTFGRVPHPAHVRHIIPVFDGQAAGYYGPRKNHGVVWHRVWGRYLGTISHFNQPGTGLTDYLIGNANVDAAELDGTIALLNEPLGDRSGYASGTVKFPWGDGLAFINDICATSPMGINAVNGEQISIELSGWYDTPLTPKQRASLIALTAYWADQARIPWDVFPIWPGHGYSFVRWHNEFTGLEVKECPGKEVMDETAVLLDLVAQYMRKYQEGVDIPIEPKPYAPAVMPPWMPADLAAAAPSDHDYNGVPVYGSMRYMTALRNTPRRRYASISHPERTGPDIPKGTKFRVSHNIDNRFALTPHGTRVDLRDLSPELIIRPRSA
jgi:hypothetical protein